ncbi:MAG: DUF255 domain-containing protein [Candidatus Hodarchaeales archaeon]
MSSKKGNQLSEETSPYLLQHANNPVEWHNWEKESFEDAETADLMNKLFINIKIDREERPDLDMSYQTAVARLSRGRGGWPLTVFATPEGLAFAGGTYFPKDPSYGLPGFKQVLTYIHEEYSKNPEKIRNLSTSTKTQLEKLYDFQSVIKIDKQIQNAFNIMHLTLF